MDEIEVRELAERVRQALEPHWNASSMGRCNSASAFLVDLLRERGDPGWDLVHGGACKAGEEFDPDFAAGHCWAQREDGLMVDITGDQFGHPAVVVGWEWDVEHLEVMESTYVWDSLEVERWRQAWAGAEAAAAPGAGGL